MHDLPSQTLKQQAHARPVSGEELEVFGKYAASQFTAGLHGTLTKAVVETVKQAGLSPEQVKRVVEFTNVNAYLETFHKLSSGHRYIDLHGGPANPSEVLKDLNDGGGGTVFDHGAGDYNLPPPAEKNASLINRNLHALGVEKTASAEDDDLLTEAFTSEDKSDPYADPWRDSLDMREKLAAARDVISSEMSGLEIQLMDLGDDMYRQVKQASLDGVPLGHVVQAWASVVPGPGYVKVAFQVLAPRLLAEEVLNVDQLGDSLTKTASGNVNMEHPLVGSFAAYCHTLDKLAASRKAHEALHVEYQRIDGFLKKVSGLIPKAWSGAKSLAEGAATHTGSAAEWAGKNLVSDRAGEIAGKVVSKATQHAPEIATAIAAKEGYDRLKYNPNFQQARYAVASRIPFTQSNLQREYALQTGQG